MSKLQQNKGTVKLKGKIFNLHSDKKDSKFENESIKKLNFGIKTADDNVHFVQLLQFKNNKRVWVSWRDENKKNHTKEINWNERLNYKTGNKTVIGVRVKSKNDEEVVNLVADDAIDYILSSFEDGDDVFVLCDVNYREYNDKTIQDKEIKSIFAAKEEIDFAAEDFEEINDFEQEIVFEKAIANKDGKILVYGRIIDYKKDFILVPFVVNGNENKELAKYLVKQCDFGDILKIVGKVHNRVIYKEIEQEQPQFLIGSVPKSYKNTKKQRVIDSERKEFEILGITEHKKGIYKAEDFAKNKEEENDNEDLPDFLK